MVRRWQVQVDAQAGVVGAEGGQDSGLCVEHQRAELAAGVFLAGAEQARDLAQPGPGRRCPG